MLQPFVKLKNIFIVALWLVAITPAVAQYHPDTSHMAPTTGPVIWSDMRHHFSLHYRESRPAIQQQIRWYQRNANYLYHILANAEPYLSYVYAQARKRHLPAELALVPFIESEFNPFAYSPAGAAGLWQFMPGTASGFGIPINWWYDGRRDFVVSTKYALNYFSYLNDFFDHNWLHAIAAYDSGEGRMQAAIRSNQHRGRRINFWQLPLPHETARYIPKLLALVSIIKHPHQYGITLPPIRRNPNVRQVPIKRQIQLSTIAQFAELEVDTVRMLNPGFRRRTTGPAKQYLLVLPSSHVAKFNEHYQAHKKTTTNWKHHVVKSGENLSVIAHHYHTSPRLVKQANDLSESRIYPNQQLIVPTSRDIHIRTAQNREQKMTFAADNPPGPKRYLHLVKRGESYLSLSKKYQVSVRSIRFWNNLARLHQLKAGEKLVIWSKHKARTAHLAWQPYRISPGDSLSVIALRHHTTVAKLKAQNKLQNNLLRAGKAILVPVKVYS